MSTAAVERPMTAQQRVLSANNPPSRAQQQQQQQQSYHQRMAANSRGAGVAAAFSGPAPSAAASAEKSAPPPPPRRGPEPSEFLAGPTAPGHVKHGVRRYEDRNSATVGLALTEDWIRGHAEDEAPAPRQATRHRGPRDNLNGPSCSIRTEEAKARPMRAPGANHHGHSRTAPFLETELPQEPLPKEPLVGKRRFHSRDNGDILSTPLPPPPPAAGEEERAAEQASASNRRNRANESHDVLNLGRYSAEQLMETERKVVLGPREFTPQNLPPRQRPKIARVKSSANATHDIFGTGQGAKDQETVHCKRRGANAPKSSSHVNLFDDSTPEQTTPAKPFKPNDLLDYNEAEPRVSFKAEKKNPAAPANNTAAAAAAGPRQPPAKVESDELFAPSEKGTAEEKRHRGRGRGMCQPKGNAIF